MIPASGDEATVYVRLVDEPVPVWRPVRARRIATAIYEILNDQAVPDDEDWEFGPGSRVLVEAVPSPDGTLDLRPRALAPDDGTGPRRDALTRLEEAALLSIFSETPTLAGALHRQMAAAAVVRRENTGPGFLTTIAVPPEVPAIEAPRVLGRDTQARIPGLREGLGFVLFLEDGRLCLLEGHAWGPESTAGLDLAGLDFAVFRAPVAQPG